MKNLLPVVVGLLIVHAAQTGPGRLATVKTLT
jgi:hypothetical protein